MKHAFCFFFVLQLLLLNLSNASVGDRSPFFQNCLKRCVSQNCSTNGVNDIDENIQYLVNKILFWSCKDNCNYDCMWKTVLEFENRQLKIPQFYGKWPFKRILGCQEPASVIFSLLNLFVVVKWFLKFKRKVRKDAPLYNHWTYFSYININTWIWSAIYHARDVDFTEKMDYIGSFTVIYCFSYCQICRLFRDIPKCLKILLRLTYVLFYLNYIASIILGSIVYDFNMKLNLFIGLTTASVWLLWSALNCKKQPYVYNLIMFVSLGTLSVLLEILDKPPFFYIFDFHSIFHLVSAPLIPFLYSFIIDDCKYLREKEDAEKRKKSV